MEQGAERRTKTEVNAIRRLHHATNPSSKGLLTESWVVLTFPDGEVVKAAAEATKREEITSFMVELVIDKRSGHKEKTCKKVAC